MNKKIIALIMTAVMLFPTTSITALASNSGLEVQGSNVNIFNTSDEVEAGSYTIEGESSIVEESVNEITVDNNGSVSEAADNSDTTQSQQGDIQQTETNQENAPQVDSQMKSNTAVTDTNQATVTEDKAESESTDAVNDLTNKGPQAVNGLKYKTLNYKTVKLTWEASQDATQYIIYRTTDKDGNFEQIKVTTSTTYTSKVSCGQVYYYKVIPYKENLAGEEAVLEVKTKPGKVSSLKATVTNTTVKLTWNKGKGASSYYIYRSEKKNSGYEKIAETKKVKYYDKKLKQGKSYYYRVYSVRNQTMGTKVATKKACKIPTGPKAVKSLKYKANDYRTISLSWKASKGATKYIIYRATSLDGKYKKVKTTTSTTYKQSKLSCGKIYYYKVIPYAGSLPGKEKIMKAYTKPYKVTNLKASVTDTSIKLTWKKAKGASSYSIYRSTNKNSGYTNIGEVKKTKYYDNNLIPGETYYYRVYPVSNQTKGKKAACSATAPKLEITNVTIESNEMRAVWISYLDYGTLKDKNEKAFTQNLDAIYDAALEQNVNTVIVHVRAFSDAVYPSKYYKWANFITSDSGGLDYDPLKIMVEEAHKKGLSFQAWINPYRTADGGRVNPASTSAVKKIVAGVEEIVQNYDVDGIHFDDYFYLSSDSTSQAEKMKNVNNMVTQVYAKIKSINSNVVFGISPAGNVEYAQSIGCDVDTWLSRTGYVDYICPQLYWSDDYVTKSGTSTKMFTNTMKQWASLNKNHTAMYAGLALYKAGTAVENAWGSDYGWGNSTSNLYEQYKNAKNSGYSGYCLYRYGSFSLSAAKKELANLKKLSQ